MQVKTGYPQTRLREQIACVYILNVHFHIILQKTKNT